jgi:uncharacterized repeat protein (TIGR02059 family)
VNNQSSNNVSVIDTTNDTVSLTTIPVGDYPSSSTLVDTKLYVNNQGSNKISVINTATDTVLTTISLGDNDSPSSSTAVGTKLYVNNYGSSKVSVIDTTNDTVIKTISLGYNTPGSSTAVGTKLYVNNQNSNNVSVIDTDTDTVLTTISVVTYLYSSTAVGTKLYVNNLGSNNVSVINTTTDTVIATIDVGSSPYSSTAVGTKLYVNNYISNNVSVINTTTDTLLSWLVFSSSKLTDATLILNYDETLDSSSVPATGDFLVKVNGNTVAVSTVNITHKEVILTLASIPSLTDTVTVNYTKGSNPIQDTTGNDSLDLTNKAVTVLNPSLISVGTNPYSSTAVGTKLYVNNKNSSTVSVINTATDTVLATIPVGDYPSSSTIVGTKLYVNNAASNNVSVINTINDTVSLTTIPVGTNPSSSTAVGTKLYVNNLGSNNVSVIDTTNDTVSLTTIPVGTYPSSSTAVDTKLYVNNQSSSTVSVIDTTNDTLLTTIDVGLGTYPSSSTIVGTKLYVNNYLSNNVSVIDTTDDTVLKTIPVGDYPYSSIIVGTKLYVNNLDSNNVSVINTTNDTVSLTTIPAGDYPYSSTIVGTKVYVNNANSDNVSVIDTTTDTFLTNISVETNPYSSTAVGTKLYVNNADSNNVSVIDTTLIAPIFSKAEVLGANLTLTYSYALDLNSIPATSDFAVKVNGNAVTVSAVNITDKKVILTLASAPALTDTVTVSYTKGSNPIQDITGGASLDLTNEVAIVLNNSFVGTQTLYGADGSGYNSDTKLYILDPDSGDIIGDPIGLTGHNINGMDFNKTTGILYGNTNSDPDGEDSDDSKPKSLFTINTANGLVTWLGTIEDSDNNTLAFPDIAFKSDGILYGFANDEQGEFGLTNLYTIATTCPGNICLATRVSNFELSDWTYGGGLAFDSNDNLYLFRDEDSGFQKLNPDTGEVLSHTDYANPSVGNRRFIAAKFDGNDNLIASRSNQGQSPSDLVKINLENGMITSTGEDNPVMPFMTALAFYLEPAISIVPPTHHSSSGSLPWQGQIPVVTPPTVTLPVTPDTSCLNGASFDTTTGLPCSTTSPTTPIITRTLKFTTPLMKGKDVKDLQTYLNTHTYNCGLADGIFGNKTKQAVILFQKANKITADGIAGPITRSYLK